MSDVTLIGAGSMGVALGRALLAAGHGLTVWNRTPEKARPLIEDGATPADAPRAALSSSPVTLVCIRTHADTLALLRAAGPEAVRGRLVVELSTGDASEARALSDWLEAAGAGWQIGMIAVFPKDIGKRDSAIVTTGPDEDWHAVRPLTETLGGASSRIGPDPAALAALYAALFLPRQGFMLGMIYGALLCRRAGISMEDYVRQLPLTIKVVHDYYDLFAATVPKRAFSDPPASMATYAAAFADVASTFERLGVRGDLPALLGRLVDEGVDAGLGECQITALTELFGKETA